MILLDGNGLAKKNRDINGGDVDMLKRLWDKFIQKIVKDVEKELIKDFKRVGYRKHDGENFSLKYIDFQDFNTKFNSQKV